MSASESTTTPVTALQNTLREYVARGELPGLIYLVEFQGNTIVEAIGDMDLDGSPMRRDTIVRISSMTKPITAAATLILVDEGKVALDDPVDHWLPELANRRVLHRPESPLDDTVPAIRAITVRDLLTSRMGIGIPLAPPETLPIQRTMSDLHLGQGPPDYQGVPEPDEWMRRVGKLPLMHQPGEHWSYGTASDVLGVLISRVSRQSFNDFLRDRLLGPLEMSDTGFWVPPDKIHRLATSYGVEPDTGSLQVHDPADGGDWSRSPAFTSGAGGLVSTLDDYLAFVRMLLNGGNHKFERLLSIESVEFMTNNHLSESQREGARPLLDGWGWGCGVAVELDDYQRTTPAIAYGWNGGLGTSWLSFPRDNVIAILLTQLNWTSPSYWSLEKKFRECARQVIAA